MQLHRVDKKDKIDQILYMKSRRKTVRERKERDQQQRLVGLHTTLSLFLALSFYLLLLGSFLLAFTRFLPLPPPGFHSSFVQKAVWCFSQSYCCIQYKEAVLILLWKKKSLHKILSF